MTLESFDKFFPQQPAGKKAFNFSGGLSEEHIKNRIIGGMTAHSLVNPPEIELDFSDQLSVGRNCKGQISTNALARRIVRLRKKRWPRI
ncbi:TPA: hypothetical protein DCW54_02105 [Candidatus Dependentiae bacterium]|nr:hypothetical protein [Candidatus Dependentiae bacterium]